MPGTDKVVDSALKPKSPPKQSRYKLPVCKDDILPPPSPKQPDRPIDMTTQTYQTPKIEDEPVDVDATEPELNVDIEENAPQQEGIIHDV